RAVRLRSASPALAGRAVPGARPVGGARRAVAGGAPVPHADGAAGPAGRLGHGAAAGLGPGGPYGDPRAAGSTPGGLSGGGAAGAAGQGGAAGLRQRCGGGRSARWRDGRSDRPLRPARSRTGSVRTPRPDAESVRAARSRAGPVRAARVSGGGIRSRGPVSHSSHSSARHFSFSIPHPSPVRDAPGAEFAAPAGPTVGRRL